MKAVPFKIDISDAELTDLRDRLGHARFAAQVEPGWQSGTDTAYLRELLRYWCSGYDWSERQRKLNELPQFTADIKGETIHFVHVRAVPSDRPSVPLLLLHGWPGSFVQFAPLIPLLTNPTAHGASPKTVSFDTVAPSLPGFGFSSQPEEPGMSVAKMAPLLHALMTEVLGYDRYAMRSSDLGAGVAACIGAAHKKAIIGSHAGGTNPFVMQVPDDLSREEKAFVKQAQEWMQAEMAYAQEHSSKPQTIANALADTPSGLASWIVEKLWRWGDTKLPLEQRLDRDAILDNLSVYWFTNTIGSSIRLYAENMRDPKSFAKADVPTAMLMSPHDMFPTPREWAERQGRVDRWTEIDKGGHFLEWEVPDLVAADLREFFSVAP